MDSTKYVGMDVHKDTISIAVMNSAGKVVMESVLETKALTILQFIQGLRGSLLVTFEEGTWAAWLYDLLKPHVTKVTVCNPRKNALLKSGNKSDRIDAQKLAELLRTNQLKPVYHGEHGVRTLKELGRSYLTLTKDVTRVMNRIKALYRSWAIPCSGSSVYGLRVNKSAKAPKLRTNAEPVICSRNGKQTFLNRSVISQRLLHRTSRNGLTNSWKKWGTQILGGDMRRQLAN